MSIKRCQPARVDASVHQEPEAEQEIENFLQAVSSYPDRFARNPCLSFEQHMFSVVAAKAAAAGGRRD